MSDLLYRLLQQEEKLKLEPYRDSEGFWTIGYGHLIDRRSGSFLPPWVMPAFPLTEQECEELLRRDIAGHLQDLSVLLDTSKFDEVRQTVFGSMVFQLGVGRMSRFRDTIAAAKVQDWKAVAAGMRDSNWYQQTPFRVERLARAVESGDVRDLGIA